LLAARRAPKTVEAYRRDLTALRTYLGKPVAEATLEELETYTAQLRADGLSAATIARRTAATRSFYRHQQLLGAREDNPAAGVHLPRRPKPLPKTLSPGEAERLIEAAAGTAPRSLRDHTDELMEFEGKKRGAEQEGHRHRAIEPGIAMRQGPDAGDSAGKAREEKASRLNPDVGKLKQGLPVWPACSRPDQYGIGREKGGKHDDVGKQKYPEAVRDYDAFRSRAALAVASRISFRSQREIVVSNMMGIDRRKTGYNAHC